LIDAITVRNAVKVWATFSRKFWLSSPRLAAAASDVACEGDRGADGERLASSKQGPEFWDILCPDLDFPEIWAPQRPEGIENGSSVTKVDGATSSQVHVLTAFVCSSKADALSKLGPEAAVQKLLAQLDLVFGQQSGHCSNDETMRPATAAFVAGGMMDWSKEQYIQGGYSSPSLGMPAGARVGLQEAPGGKVFFAGEHTNEKLNSCLQGAMQTGRLAAQSILAKRIGIQDQCV
jgi:hypothetical protein